MIYERRIGDVTVRNIIEYTGPTHDPAYLFPKADPAALGALLPQLAPAHYAPRANRLIVTIQLWAIFAGNEVIVVDTGAGNHRSRGAPRMHMLNTLLMEWLAAAGITRENVTQVVMTHMHQDHVGWNTIRAGEGWEPTFPNARYHFPKIDFDRLNEKWQAGETGVAGGSFADSVIPVMQAGLGQMVEAGDRLFDLLDVEAAYGHSHGMLNYRLRDGGEEGVFCADIFHSPAQILDPQLNTGFCELPEQAAATRAAFLARAAESGCLVMPTHFGEPYAGYIRRQGSGYAFEPAALERA